MRQVFTSPRLENVEGVAKLLLDNDIEVKITNGRTFRGAIRGNFSYREQPDTEQLPAVWVVRSEDQPKARELLREAGLLASGRSPTTYLATPTVHQLRGEDGSDAARRRAFRYKAALFVGIAAALGMSMLALRKPTTAIATTPAARSPTAPLPRPAARLPADTVDAPEPPTESFAVQTPKALAAMLVNAELGAQSVSRLCLSIDGQTPSQEQFGALRLPSGVRVSSVADCAKTAKKDVLTIAIGPYMTDGSGIGTVTVELTDTGKGGKPRIDTRTLEVERDDADWRVRRVVQ